MNEFLFLISVYVVYVVLKFYQYQFFLQKKLINFSLIVGLFNINSWVLINHLIWGILIVLIGVLYGLYFYKLKLTRQFNSIFLISLFLLLFTNALLSTDNILVFFFCLEAVTYCIYTIVYIEQKELYKRGLMYYFLFNSLFSIILLSGIIFIQIFSEASFDDSVVKFKTLLTLSDYNYYLSLIGLSLFNCGLFCKLGLFPFSIWQIFVYRLLSYSSLLILLSYQKPLLFLVFMKFNLSIFMWSWKTMWLQQVLIALIVLSLIISAVGVLVQVEVKKILVYSSINHLSFWSLGFLGACKSESSSVFIIGGVISYLIVYVLSMLLLVGGLCSLRETQKNSNLFTKQFLFLSDFKGIINQTPLKTILIWIAVLSLAGFPPFAGFVVKWWIVCNSYSIYNSGLMVWLVVLVLVSSLIMVIAYFRFMLMFYLNDSILVNISTKTRVKPTLLIQFLQFLVKFNRQINIKYLENKFEIILLYFYWVIGILMLFGIIILIVGGFNFVVISKQWFTFVSYCLIVFFDGLI